MSSGSRVRREGTIAMSSKPYARRRLLAASDLYLHRRILAVAADEKTPRSAGPKGVGASAVESLVGDGSQVSSEHSNRPHRRECPWICSIDMSDGDRHTLRAARASRRAARRPGASATRSGRRRSLEEQPHLYIKPSAPFTSGNIHIGHVRSYSIGDAYARFRRARGDAVLFAFGFDAFGLPAELGAIAGGEPPSDWVSRCAEHMTGQLERLGFSFDWERTFLSSDPIMYRWSQWLFLTLLEAGPDLPRHRQRRLVRHLPDDARLDPGRAGRHLLALPRARCG